jgi:hypothetical protein
VIDEALVGFLSEYYGVTNEVDDRIYPAPLPQGVTLPAITYQDVSNVGSYSNDGPDCLVRARYQLTHWAETKEAANRVEQMTRTAMNGYYGTWPGGLTIGGVFRLNSFTLQERDTQLWQAITDYQINAIGE